MTPARILIADDEPEWQDLVGELLADEEYTYRLANNYQNALEQLDRESFHVVFLDLKLHEIRSACARQHRLATA